MKKLAKVSVMSAVGLGAIGAVTATAVSCGSTVSDLRVYRYNFASTDISLSRDEKRIVIWAPFDFSKESEQRVNGPVRTMIDNAFNAAGFGNPQWQYHTYTNLSSDSYTNLTGGDAANLPDIVFGYPDTQAIYRQYNLAVNLDDPRVGGGAVRSLVASALVDEAFAVLSPDNGPYSMPFSKSTELTYFNAIGFAKVFSDLSKALGDAGKTFTVPANSAQDRLIKLILSDTTLADEAANYKVSTEIYVDSDDQASGSTTDGKNQYDLSTVAAKYAAKTAASGIWASDKTAIEANYVLVNADALKQVDWSKRIFESYDDILVLTQQLASAYRLKQSESPLDRSYIAGVDSPANIVYSYQFDKAGHSPDTFFMKVAKDAEGKANAVEFNFDRSLPGGSTFYDGMKFLADLFDTNATYQRDLNSPTGVYVSRVMNKHQILFGWESSSGGSRAAETSYKSNKEVANPGEIYMDLQPIKASPSETMGTVINQGPSIFVTGINSKWKFEIARIIKDLYGAAGKLTGTVADATSPDTGPLNTTGYMYPDAGTFQAGSTYVQSLDNAVKDSSVEKWGNYVAKRLMANFFLKAQAQPAVFNAYTNPATPSTTLLRSAFDQEFVTRFNGSSGKSAEAMLSAAVTTFAQFGVGIV